MSLWSKSSLGTPSHQASTRGRSRGRGRSTTVPRQRGAQPPSSEGPSRVFLAVPASSRHQPPQPARNSEATYIRGRGHRMQPNKHSSFTAHRRLVFNTLSDRDDEGPSRASLVHGIGRDFMPTKSPAAARHATYADALRQIARETETIAPPRVIRWKAFDRKRRVTKRSSPTKTYTFANGLRISSGDADSEDEESDITRSGFGMR